LSYYGQDLLLKYIDKESVSDNAVFDAVQKYAIINKKAIFRKETLRESWIDEEDTEIDYKFANNVKISEDSVDFDLIVEATFSAQRKQKYDYGYESETIWLRVSCQMTVTDKLDKFYVAHIQDYSKINLGKNKNTAIQNLVPLIERKNFDLEAEIFLKKYCPESLITAMPIPIEKIAKEKLLLTIIGNKKLTSDHTIFGQICFLDGLINTLDENTMQYIETPVKRGTIFIDPQTYYLRNLGCVNNTIAHEVFHWIRHRVYATIKSFVSEKDIVVHRCPTNKSNNQIKKSQEDWLEWQANGIAPKILMPKEMTDKKICEFIKKFNYIPDNECFEELKLIINNLSEFFQVSKQAAKIRMIELGYEEASKVYNYDSETAVISNDIDSLDVFFQSIENNEFRALIDLGLFRYVENHFVINSPDYIQQTESGLVLTEKARLNIKDCSLEFQHNIEIALEDKVVNSILPRNIAGYKNVGKYVDTSHNQQIISFAMDAEKFGVEFDLTKDLFGTAAEVITKLMRTKKWNSAKFTKYTELSADLYSKITKHPNKEFEMEM